MRDDHESSPSDIVDGQLRDNDPPETSDTLTRLITEGHSYESAVGLIAAVVAHEITDVAKRGESFDKERYTAALHALPRLIWEENL